MATVETIVKQDLCSGCGLCAGLSPGIEMQEDPLGFQRPVLKPGTSVETAPGCPGEGARIVSKRAFDRLWGPLASCHRGWARAKDIRHHGSSGGALSALCISLLETGQVDAILHCGAAADAPDKSIARISRTRAEVIAAAGSRYAPSATLARLGELVKTGDRFAVVGKPCEISALAAARRNRADLAASFPVLLSFFCAGVPSQRATEGIVEELMDAPSRLRSFWYRGQGWPGRTTAVAMDGQTRSMSYADSWGTRLSPHVQTRCKLCADGVGMAADLVCADAWEVDQAGYPLFEEKAGESVILTRTTLGDRVLAAAAKTGHVEHMPLSVTKLEAMQPGQVRRRRTVAARLLGRALTGRRVPIFRGFRQWQAARDSTILAQLRALLGGFYRAATSRPF